jgi:hypothetical protein
MEFARTPRSLHLVNSLNLWDEWAMDRIFLSFIWRVQGQTRRNFVYTVSALQIQFPSNFQYFVGNFKTIPIHWSWSANDKCLGQVDIRLSNGWSTAGFELDSRWGDSCVVPMDSTCLPYRENMAERLNISRAFHLRFEW